MDPATAAIANAKVVDENGDHIIMQEKPEIGSWHYFPPDATLSDLKGIAKSKIMIYVHSQKTKFMESSNLDDLRDKSQKQICALVLKYAPLIDPTITKSDTELFLLNHTKEEMSNFPIKDLQQHLLNYQKDLLNVHTLETEYILQELEQSKMDTQKKPVPFNQVKLNAIDFTKNDDRDNAVQINPTLKDTRIEDLTPCEAQVKYYPIRNLLLDYLLKRSKKG